MKCFQICGYGEEWPSKETREAHKMSRIRLKECVRMRLGGLVDQIALCLVTMKISGAIFSLVLRKIRDLFIGTRRMN